MLLLLITSARVCALWSFARAAALPPARVYAVRGAIAQHGSQTKQSVIT